MATNQTPDVHVYKTCFIVNGVMIPKDNIAYVDSYSMTNGEQGIRVHLKYGTVDVIAIEGHTVEGFTSVYNGAPF